MIHHDIPPKEFLNYVHNIDLTFMKKDKVLREQLENLDMRKLIFTNGSTDHAKNVLAHLGIDDLFEGIFDISDAEYRPKPEPKAFDLMVKKFEIDPEETIYKEDSIILSIILPYQNAIEDKMNEIVTYTKVELNKNGAESTLGNFVTDLCLNYAEAEVCIMNNGGLRTSINKGPVTVGKLYELMPFENELVVLKIDSVEFNRLLKYITERGGEPVSGINIIMNSKKELISYTPKINFKEDNTIRQEATHAHFNYHIASDSYGVVECVHQIFLHGVV